MPICSRCRQPACGSSPFMGPGAGRTWRCGCSPMQSCRGGRSSCSTTDGCGGPSPTCGSSAETVGAGLGAPQEPTNLQLGNQQETPQLPHPTPHATTATT